MRHLKFTEDRDVLDHDGKVVETYKAGEVHAFKSDASCQHWLNRNIAVEVEAPGKAPAEKPATPAATATADPKSKP